MELAAVVDEQTPTDGESDPAESLSRERLVEQIVATVAEAKSRDPDELRPLVEVLNVEAVDRALDAREEQTSFGFEYEGGLVRVSESGVEFTPDED
jgi:hypothetical protein